MSTDPQSPPETSVPSCYRHPGRETYVRCTRCDRYICPDCMRDAAVGHQCPECVAEGNRGVRQPRTAFGARAAASATPVVTYSLIAACVLVYVAELASWRVIAELQMIGRWGSIGVAEGEWYRLFTAMFLHERGGNYGFLHILLNMLVLWMLGPALEQVLGRWRFLTLFVLSGLGGWVLLYLVDPGVGGLGASGAVFGLFGAYFMVVRRMGGQLGPIVMVLGINLVLTFTMAAISWQAHIGGLVVGGLLGLAFAYAPAARRTLVHVGAPVATLVLLLALVALKTAELNSGVA
ncbi:rhomboid family intramembrane serine protease [Spirillospora albida]|uniref:rhomboid family intramembrane serine protease n=1 Tax=Spirillospora albida TaxID=58123 RepID=UPI0004C185F1|nr:rhomboid family intramembrane serine protease [Spirillospora albida]